MSRLHVPATVDAAPVASRGQLNSVAKTLGRVPNLFRVVANSPAALTGYLGLNAALSASTLDVKTRERVALAVAAVNGCDYCLSAHADLGRNLAQLDDAEIAANRSGTSNDPTAAAAVRFATEIVHARGHVSDAQLAAVRAAGFGDHEVIDIVLAVSLNTFTNYVNEVARTDIDFPVAAVRHAAA